MTQGNQANARFWFLHELRRLRAAVRVGSISAPNAQKERKAIVRDLAALRKAKQGVHPNA